MEFVFLLVIAGILALVIYAPKAAEKRRKMLAAWAAGHGLTFDKERDKSFDSRFDQLECVNEGHSRYAYNIMRGDWGELPIVAFDYHYATGHGKNRTDHRFSAVIIQSPFPLKPLRVRPEGFFDKIGAFFGFDDIDFESAEFSHKFHVKAADKRWAYDVIHQRMMVYLMTTPDLSLQFDERNIVVWDSSVFDPDDFEAAAVHVRNVIDLIPEYVVEQQTGRRKRRDDEAGARG